MNDLAHDFLTLTRQARTGSFKTQRTRSTSLLMMAKQLYALGYQQLRAPRLTLRHANKLVKLWKTQGITGHEIENRLAHLRWVTRQVGNPGALPATNAVWDLAPRQAVPTVSKAQTLDRAKWAQIEDPWVQMSLLLQAAFMLRRDESLLIRPHQADQGTYLVLQGSWTKGGRPRVLAIHAPEQRQVLDQAKAFVPTKESSLIPAHKSLKEQRNTYTYWLAKVGLSRMHGLRHAGAQERFETLTGYPAPLKDGPTRASMTPAQREADATARLIVSAELGHGRRAIVKTYVG